MAVDEVGGEVAEVEVMGDGEEGVVIARGSRSDERQVRMGARRPTSSGSL